MIFQARRAFSLVEVTLALAVAAFGLIAIFGLLPTGLTSNEASIRQTAAADILAGIIADLRQAPTANEIAAAAATTPSTTLNPVSPRLKIDITKGATSGYLDESGALNPGSATSLANTSSQTGNSYYLVTISIINPPPAIPPVPAVRTATTAAIQISWPAHAPTINPSNSLTAFIALDRN